MLIGNTYDDWQVTQCANTYVDWLSRVGVILHVLEAGYATCYLYHVGQEFNCTQSYF